MVGVVVLILAIFLLGGYLGYRRANNAPQAQYSALNDTISYYKYKYNQALVYAAEKDQIITTQREALQRGELEKAELKALNLKKVSELTALKIKIDTLLQAVSHTDKLVYIDTCMGYDMPQAAIMLPFSFIDDDEWMAMRGDFDEWGQLDINLRVDAGLDVWTGLDKSTKQYKAIVTTDNPYINITGIRSFKFDVPRPKKFGLGVFAGYGITVAGEVKATPMIGVGLNYNLITF